MRKGATGVFAADTRMRSKTLLAAVKDDRAYLVRSGWRTTLSDIEALRYRLYEGSLLGSTTDHRSGERSSFIHYLVK